MLLSCWPLVIWISSFIFFIMLKLLPEENFCVLCTNMHKFDFDFKQRTSCLFNIPFKYLQICALLVLLWCYSFFFFFLIGSPVSQAGPELLTLQASVSLSAGMTGICYHAWKSSVTKSVLGTKCSWLEFTGIIYWWTLKSFISFSTHFVFLFSHKSYQNNSSNSKVINSFA